MGNYMIIITIIIKIKLNQISTLKAFDIHWSRRRASHHRMCMFRQNHEYIEMKVKQYNNLGHHIKIMRDICMLC